MSEQIQAAPSVPVEKTASQLVREHAQELAKTQASIRIRANMALERNTTWGRDVSEAVLAALNTMADELGLSVSAGDVMMLGGRVYISLQGRLKVAHREKEFRGFLLDEFLPKDQWLFWGVRADAEFAWKTSIGRGEMVFTEVGWGGGSREQQANQGKGQPVAKPFPAEMARARARARSLSLAFPVGVPSVEEVGVQEGIEIPEEFIQKVMGMGAIPHADPAAFSIPESETVMVGAENVGTMAVGASVPQSGSSSAPPTSEAASAPAASPAANSEPVKRRGRPVGSLNKASAQPFEMPASPDAPAPEPLPAALPEIGLVASGASVEPSPVAEPIPTELVMVTSEPPPPQYQARLTELGWKTGGTRTTWIGPLSDANITIAKICEAQPWFESTVKR